MEQSYVESQALLIYDALVKKCGTMSRLEIVTALFGPGHGTHSDEYQQVGHTLRQTIKTGKAMAPFRKHSYGTYEANPSYHCAAPGAELVATEPPLVRITWKDACLYVLSRKPGVDLHIRDICETISENRYKAGCRQSRDTVKKVLCDGVKRGGSDELPIERGDNGYYRYCKELDLQGLAAAAEEKINSLSETAIVAPQAAASGQETKAQAAAATSDLQPTVGCRTKLVGFNWPVTALGAGQTGVTAVAANGSGVQLADRPIIFVCNQSGNPVSAGFANDLRQVTAEGIQEADTVDWCTVEGMIDGEVDEFEIRRIVLDTLSQSMRDIKAGRELQEVTECFPPHSPGRGLSEKLAGLFYNINQLAGRKA